MKRAAAFLLAIVMIASLLPVATANEEALSFEYILTADAFNLDEMKPSKNREDYRNGPYYDMDGEQKVIRNATLADYEFVIGANAYGKGNIAFNSMDTDLTDRRGTAPWKYVSGKMQNLFAISNANGLDMQFNTSNYGTESTAPFAALELVVKTPGEYMLSIAAQKRADGVAPAVFFFKKDGEISTAADLKAENIAGYFDSSNAGEDYTDLCKVSIPEEGSYIIAFRPDKKSKEINENVSASKYQYFRLFGIRLLQIPEDKLTGISLSAEKVVLYAGESAKLNLFEDWTQSGEKKIESFKNVRFASTDERALKVSADGRVEALSASAKPVTVTATYNGSVAKLDFEVIDKKTSQLGKSFTYVFNTRVMKDQTVHPEDPSRLNAGGNLDDLRDVDSFDEIDGTKTALWAYNNSANITWRNLLYYAVTMEPSPEDYKKEGGSYFAIKIRVPEKGKYDIWFSPVPNAHGAEADVYIYPVGNIAVTTPKDVKGKTPVAHFDCSIFEPSVKAGAVDIPAAGDYYLYMDMYSDNEILNHGRRHELCFRDITLAAVAGSAAKLEVSVDKLSSEGETLPLNAYRKVSFNIVDASGYKLSDIDANNVIINSIEITKGKDTIATISEDYTINTLAVGNAEVTVDVTYGGARMVETFEFKVADIGKTGRTIYSDEMIAAARENISKYNWAAKERDKVVELADRFVEAGTDYLWGQIAGQDIPRTISVGLTSDTNKYICPGCKENIYRIGGNYPWKVETLESPWKIICPACSRKFPTNDFAKFYELGRTQENGGDFNRIDALNAHREMLIEKKLLSKEALALTDPGEDGSATWKLYYGYGVKGGYLHNDLYPNIKNRGSKVTLTEGETVGGWCVDDGLGYRTGRINAAGIEEEVYAFVGYYSHFATYFGPPGDSIATDVLDALGRAYMYTGKEKYGRLGAIILDRIADIYPTLHMNSYGSKYFNTNGGTPTGQAVGSIWECFVGEAIAEAYDMFWPMYDDPEVIKFLNEKAVYYGLENDKSNAAKIRQNIEDGVCREVFDAMIHSRLQGNFGIHQATLAKTAIALDTYPDTQIMLDWLYAAAETDHRSYNSGGDVNKKLIATVYRDGQNVESPYYNEMGISDFIDTGIYLDRYKANGGEFNQISIFEHPKYIAMINAYQPMYLVSRGIKGMADSGGAIAYSTLPKVDPLINAFYYIKDKEYLKKESVKMAQHLYLVQGSTLDSMHYDIFTKNPENLSKEIKAIIKEYGEYPYNESSMLPAYGFAALRAGSLTKGAKIYDTTRDFTLNFSGHSNHNHDDFLDIGIEAFGLGMTTDLGYPENPTDKDAFRNQWLSRPLSHNTVVVNEAIHGVPDGTPQMPIHYDTKNERVQLVDARTPDAYAACSEFRRSVVMIDVSDEVSYGVDFFRVVGGDDHLWTFAANSDTTPVISDNLKDKFVAQKDAEGNYIGSYAGPDVPFGPDPISNHPHYPYVDHVYPTGYTWLYDIDKALNPKVSSFSLDYIIRDFRNQSRNGKMDIGMKVIMQNDFEADEITLASGIVQRQAGNAAIDHLERVLVRRKGKNLDSLFTTIYAPYANGNDYIKSVSAADAKAIAGKENAGDAVKALKVELTDGRIDYIVYATNKNVTYKITDENYSFDFRGFVGVWTLKDGKNTYSYLCDGDILGEGENKISGAVAAITGKITAFQKELSVDNWVDVEFGRDVTKEELEALVGRMINIARTSKRGNSCYVIENVTFRDARHARIGFGNISTISGYVDENDESKGFIYDIENGKTFEIAMSLEK